MKCTKDNKILYCTSQSRNYKYYYFDEKRNEIQKQNYKFEEFQLRNRHTPTEIAKEMFTLGLSNREEIRTYDNIDDINGWKIIKEETCDYEIIYVRW